MIPESVSDTALSVTTGHSDVDNFVLISDNVDARLIRNCVPLYGGERYWFGKWNVGRGLHRVGASSEYTDQYY